MPNMNSCLSYLARQLLRMIVIIAVVATLAFVLTATAPLDPVTAYLGFDRMQISPEQQQRIIQRWGLDQPPTVRFTTWAKNVIRGDLGDSLVYNEPVISVIQKRFAASLKLMALAWTLSGIIGFVLGSAGRHLSTFTARQCSAYVCVCAGVQPDVLDRHGAAGCLLC